MARSTGRHRGPTATTDATPATRRRFVPAVLTVGAAKLAGRISWGLGDQAVSSLTNFTVGVVVARSLGAVDFGGFSLAWVTYGLVLNIARGLATDPLVVRFSGEPGRAWREAARRASGVSLLVGCAAGVISAGAGLVVGGTLGPAFVALGMVLPALLLQDAWRFAFFSSGQGRKAFVNDAIWGIALVPTLLVASLDSSVFGFVLAWGGAATVAALAGWWQSRILPWPAGVRPWLRAHRDLGLRYLVENVCQSGAAQIRMYGLGAVAGLASVGTVRGAELLLGPFLALLMGLNMVAVPEASKVVRESPRRLPLLCMLLGGAQWVAALCWGLGLLFLLPDAVGEYLLGAVWPTASLLIVPATIAMMNAGLSAGPSAGLRALGAARLSLRTQLIASSTYAVLGVAGGVVGGALGSSWGVAIATGFGTVLWWVHLRIGLRRHVAELDAPTTVLAAVPTSASELQGPATAAIPTTYVDAHTVVIAIPDARCGDLDEATMPLDQVPPAAPVPHVPQVRRQEPAPEGRAGPAELINRNGRTDHNAPQTAHLACISTVRKADQ